MGVRTNLNQRNTVPGPGAYEPDVSMVRSNAYVGGKIGTSQRAQLSSNAANEIGPGQYKLLDPKDHRGGK